MPIYTGLNCLSPSRGNHTIYQGLCAFSNTTFPLLSLESRKLIQNAARGLPPFRIATTASQDLQLLKHADVSNFNKTDMVVMKTSD